MAKYIATDEDQNTAQHNQLDFDDINAKLIGNVEAHCHSWLPGGKVKGGQYRIGGIDGSIGSSMSINLRTGQWYDHATEDKGGDLISLYAAINNLAQGDAANELQGAVNIVRMTKLTKRKPLVSESDWEHALTVPTDSPPEHWEHGEPDVVHKYADTGRQANRRDHALESARWRQDHQPMQLDAPQEDRPMHMEVAGIQRAKTAIPRRIAQQDAKCRCCHCGRRKGG